MVEGKVKWFNEAKDYGFIEQDRREDIFVHYTSIHTNGFRSLNEGEVVLFEVAQGEKGKTTICDLQSYLTGLMSSPNGFSQIVFILKHGILF